MPEKNEKQLESVESVRWVKRYKDYGGKDLWKRWVLSVEWKWEGVIDGDSGDAGNDELRYATSDESDKSSWSVGRRLHLVCLPSCRERPFIWLSWVAYVKVIYHCRAVAGILRVASIRIDDGDRVAPPYKSSVRRHADISTPLRNIQPLNVDDILDDVASCLHISLIIVQQRLSDGDGDTLDQPHGGQRLAQRIDVGRVAFNRPTRSRLLRLQTSSWSYATKASMCTISAVRRFHDAIACFFTMQDATQMAQQCPALHCTTKQQEEWMPVLPQKTEADSVAALHARAPYLVWLISLAAVAVSVILLPGCCARIAYQMTVSETMFFRHA